MRYARLFVPYRGYWDISVDLDSIDGGDHGKADRKQKGFRVIAERHDVVKCERTVAVREGCYLYHY